MTESQLNPVMPSAVAEARRIDLPVRSFLERLSRWWRKPSVATLTVIAAALIVMWNIWHRLDLTFADTAGYYLTAGEWRETGAFLRPNRLIYSPLYVVYLADLQRIFSDPLAVIIIHRMLIIVATAIFVLNAMRAIVPRAVAWMIAVWWILVSWNMPYEVHLFGFAFAALGIWLIGAGRSAWWRGLGIGALFCDGFLVRNEVLGAVGLLLLCAVGFEIWLCRKHGQSRRDTWANLGRLALPSVLIVAISVVAFSKNPKVERPKELLKEFRERQRENVPQVFAYGYKQRHPEWTLDPWKYTECGPLTKQIFGMENPRWSDAIKTNPKALFEHVSWNFQLLPAGIELGLFGNYTGNYSPDFFFHRTHGPAPLVGLVILLALWIAGGICIWQKRLYLLPLRSRRSWTWIALLCCVPTSIMAIATQHPRPAYILPLLLLLMAYTGLSVVLICQRLRIPDRSLRWLFVGVAPLILLTLAFLPHRADRRPILMDYRRLEPFGAILSHKDRVFCSNTELGFQVPFYLSGSRKRLPERADYTAIRADVPPAASLDEALDHAHVTDLYLAGRALEEEPLRLWRQLVDSKDPANAASGWHLIAMSADAKASWCYYSRAVPASARP